MTNDLPSLAEQYSVAFEQYLGGSGEAALSRAYELGREALRSGMGVLDIATIYRDAVSAARGQWILEHLTTGLLGADAGRGAGALESGR